MKLMIDKQPKECSDCLFFKAIPDGTGSYEKLCSIDGGACIHQNGKCARLKQYRYSEESCENSMREKINPDIKRKKQNEYLRQYRREHPERVQQWRKNWILKAAQRMNEMEAMKNEENLNGEHEP